MKRILSTTTLAFFVMLLASLFTTASAQPRTGGSISYQTFYDELDPYGRWVDYPDQGYVWIPDAGPDFRPYSTNGHWVWSDDYEWMWVSDYDWGWAPFHYGRWMEDPSYGWIWVPGYEWSPAWVAWRDGGDYYGWAPLRPGINININFSLGGYNPPIDYWSFAPRRYITSPRIYDYCMPRRNNVTIIHQTTIINNYNYNQNVFRTGPRRREAERYTGRINPVRFRESYNPGRTGSRNNEVSFYRPNVQRDNNRDFSPRRVERFDRNTRNDNNTSRRNDNNLPDRREANNNRQIERPADIDTRNTRPFERRREINDRVPQNRDVVDRNTRGGNNEIRERRNTERQPAQNNERRTERPDVFNRNNGNSSNQRERRNENRPQRQPSPQIEQPRQEQPRQPRQPFPQTEQRRQEQPRQPSPQIEQRRQEQPRQMERKSDNRERNINNSGDNGNGKDRGGFGRRDR
jgi:hypothetical protein